MYIGYRNLTCGIYGYIPYKPFSHLYMYTKSRVDTYRPNYTIENIHWNVLPCELGYICKGKCIPLFVKMHCFFLSHIFPTINPTCDEPHIALCLYLPIIHIELFPPQRKHIPLVSRINRCPAYNIQMHAYYHPSTSNTCFSFPHLCVFQWKTLNDGSIKQLI